VFVARLSPVSIELVSLMLRWHRWLPVFHGVGEINFRVPAPRLLRCFSVQWKPRCFDVLEDGTILSCTLAAVVLCFRCYDGTFFCGGFVNFHCFTSSTVFPILFGLLIFSRAFRSRLIACGGYKLISGGIGAFPRSLECFTVFTCWRCSCLPVFTWPKLADCTIFH
jgi:hypothetical protein